MNATHRFDRAGAVAGALALALSVVHAEPRRNYYDDPFAQATSALPGCPVPEGPLITHAEMQAQAHGRVDRGTTCFRSGRCRLPNSYLYDKEIVPRVRQFIAQDERFSDTSIWIVVQRRWVYLQGCVASEPQREALERAVRGIDDVEAVIDELMVGRDGTPRYRVAEPSR
ncbi:MAG: BON domain-containing protein [Caldimonas sp.]